jgi:hypothetical protein
MKRIQLGIGILVLAAATAFVSPPRSYAQTQGMDRRQDRRSDRDDARGTRQEGRHTSRDAKQDCKDAGGNRMECRHMKRGMKHESRKSAREKKYGDGRL